METMLHWAMTNPHGYLWFVCAVESVLLLVCSLVLFSQD